MQSAGLTLWERKGITPGNALKDGSSFGRPTIIAEPPAAQVRGRRIIFSKIDFAAEEVLP